MGRNQVAESPGILSQCLMASQLHDNCLIHSGFGYKELMLEQSLYTILQVLSLSLFEKMPILEAFSENRISVQSPQHSNQLTLFD